MSNTQHKGMKFSVWKDGMSVQDKLKNILIEQKLYIRDPSRKEDSGKHIDGYAVFGSYDCKALKRNKRTNAEFNLENTWIEFRNVYGTKGWIYGEAKYLAFERPDKFDFVDRQGLMVYLHSCGNIDFKNESRKFPEECYKLYNRWNSLDLICKIPYNDVEQFKIFSI